MNDQLVGELTPVFRGQRAAEDPFDLHCIFRPDQPDQVGEPDHMGIHRQTRHLEGIAQHHVRSLSAYAGEGDQVFHPLRHFAAETLHDPPRHSDEIGRLGVIKSAGMDHLFQFVLICRRHRFRGGIFLKQHRRDTVHFFIRALRRKDRCRQQLKGRGVVETALQFPVAGVESLIDRKQCVFQVGFSHNRAIYHTRRHLSSAGA